MASHRMSPSNPVDSKGEEFRKYLENGGVLSAITKVLLEMYSKEGDSKPQDPLEHHIGAVSVNAQELQSLRNEVAELSAELAKTKREKNELELEIQKLKLKELSLL